MPEEPESGLKQPGESGEQQLCLNCLSPNNASVHFCVDCGAPLTSYAATGPFESLFAEGHAYRQAAERPRKLIVVVGVWLVFGMLALAGATLLVIGPTSGLEYLAGGVFFLIVPSLMIWRTTANYLKRHRTGEPSPFELKEGPDDPLNP